MTAEAETIRQMAEDHCAAWSAGDAKATAGLFAEDGTISVNGAAPRRGHAEIADAARALMKEFPGVQVRVDETRHSARRAVMIWTLTGRHAETGNPVVLPGWHEWDLDDDMKVRRCLGFYDAEDLQRQIAGN